MLFVAEAGSAWLACVGPGIYIADVPIACEPVSGVSTGHASTCANLNAAPPGHGVSINVVAGEGTHHCAADRGAVHNRETILLVAKRWGCMRTQQKRLR